MVRPEYEFSPGSLCRDIEAIYTGEYSEPEFWESSFEAAMNEFYSDCVCSSAVELIAASENGCDLNTCFHFERMGEAGHREFDGTDFDPDAGNVMSGQFVPCEHCQQVAGQRIATSQ